MIIKLAVYNQYRARRVVSTTTQYLYQECGADPESYATTLGVRNSVLAVG